MAVDLSGVALARLDFDDDPVTRVRLDLTARLLEFDAAAATLLDPRSPTLVGSIRELDGRPTSALRRVRVTVSGWQLLTIREFDRDDQEWFPSSAFDLVSIGWLRAEKRAITIAGTAGDSGRWKHVDLAGPDLRARATAEFA